MATREFLRVTQETTPGVRLASPAASQRTIIRLDKGNNFPDRPEPIFWTVRGAEGNNRRVQTGSQQVKTTFSLDTLLYASQAKILLPAACTPSGATSEVLPTVTIDHGILLEDGSTFVREGYLGCTVASLDLGASNSGDGVLCRAKLGGAYLSVDDTLDNTSFPVPALTDYPSDQPQVFQFTKGHFTFRGSRTKFRSFGLSVRNHLDVLYDENTYPSAINFYGRDVDFNGDFRYVSTQDRTDYNAVTANTASIALYDGTNTITFNLHAKNYMRSVKDSLPLDKAFYQAIGAAAYLDTAAGSDLDLTITP